MDSRGREPYLLWGHCIYSTTDDGNWVKIPGKRPVPAFDDFSTMMNAFPESPDRPFHESVSDRIGQQQALTMVPSDPTIYAMSPNAPPVPSAPDGVELWPSGSSTSVEAVSRVAQTAADVAAGATALTCGTAAGWMIGKEAASTMTKSAIGNIPLIGDLVATAGGQLGALARRLVRQLRGQHSICHNLLWIVCARVGVQHHHDHLVGGDP